MKYLLLAVVVIGCLMGSTQAAVTCRRDANPDFPKPFKGGMLRICVYEGVTSYNLHSCTTEKYNFTSIPYTDHLVCTRGNQKVDAWLTSRNKARVVVTAGDLTKTFPAKDMYKNIGCIGFYTSLMLNPKVPNDVVETMFSKLVNCYISDALTSKAQDRAKNAIGIVAEVLGVIPNPYTIGVGLAIKVIVAASAMVPDPKDNDYLQFLTAHYTLMELKIRCRTLNSVEVAKCLKRENKPVSAAGTYKIVFTSCNGIASKDTYLRIYSGTTKVLTTHASFWSAGPIYQFCAGKLDEVLYKGLKLTPGKKLCIEAWERNTFEDEMVSQACLNSMSQMENKIKLTTKAGAINMSFMLNKE